MTTDALPLKITPDLGVQVEMFSMSATDSPDPGLMGGINIQSVVFSRRVHSIP
jgi:hypothetical protein